VLETGRYSLVDLDAESFRVQVLVDSVRNGGEDDDGDTDTKAVGKECCTSDDRVLRFALESVE